MCYSLTQPIYFCQDNMRKWAYRKTGTRDPSETLAGPYKNRKTGTLVGLYKTRKTGTLDPSRTLEKLENRKPIIIIIIIFYYHQFIFC